VNFYFTKGVDGYSYHCGDEVLYTTPNLGFLVDKGLPTSVVMLKHGDPEKLRTRMKILQSGFTKVGLNPDDILLVESAEWDLENLNQFISCAGSIGPFLREQGIIQ